MYVYIYIYIFILIIHVAVLITRFTDTDQSLDMKKIVTFKEKARIACRLKQYSFS